MDKVKIGMAVLKKYHFWVLCVVVLAVALGTWAKATTDLQTRTDTRKRKLEDYRNNVVKIAGEPNHPNAAFIQKIRDQHNGLKRVVYAAWKQLHEKQKIDNKLPEVLSPEFREEFEKRAGPIENFPGGEMAREYCEEYMNHIKKHFPTLFKRIERREEVSEDEPDDKGTKKTTPPRPLHGRDSLGAFPGASGRDRKETNVKKIGIVDWDEADANRTLRRFSWDKAPSTLAVLAAQEDLWVYEAVLDVIRFTNSSGKSRDKDYAAPKSRKDAAIKQIMALEIGQEAAQSWQRHDQGFAAGAPEGRGGATPGGIPMTPGTAPGTAPGHERRPGASGAATGDQEVASPLAGRYVDDKGQPVADPKQQPYAEFRMMPINMRIVIEQEGIPKLLAECSKSNMPIEVRAVRLIAAEGGAIDMVTPAAGGGAMMGDPRTLGAGPAAPGGGALPMRPGRPRGAQPGNVPAKARTTVEVDEEDWASRNASPVPIEVQGIIYIYNPPDLSKVGTGTTGGAGTGGGPAETPAEPKPATPAPAESKPAVPPPAEAKPAAPAPTPPGPGTAPATPPGTVPPTAPPGTPPGTGLPPAAPPGVPPGPVATPPGNNLAPAAKGGQP